MRPIRTLVATAIALGTVVAVTVSPSVAQTPGTGLVTVVHGLRGVVADVYLDGTVVLETFEPERSTDPLPVPAGSHLVEVRVAGSATTTPPAVTGTLNVTEGVSISAVVHLDANGQPKLTTFTNDVTPVPAGQARAIVRHTAAATPVDVSLGETALATALSNPGEAASQIGADVYDVSVTATGTGNVILAPQRLPLNEGAETSMYLIGSQSLGTLSWIAVLKDGLETPPALVQTGNSPIRSGSGLGDQGLLVGLLGAGAAIAVAGALLFQVRGRRHPVS